MSDLDPSTGKDQVQTFVQRMVNNDLHVELTKLAVAGDTVTYDLIVTRNGTQTAVRHVEAVVHNGKITAFTNK
ncbi:MAG: hypothetical protein NVS2B7_18560 [Herpetosiphon sp.]